MGLKTTKRGSNIPDVLPRAADIINAMYLATTFVAAAYLVKVVENMFTSLGSNYEDVLKRVKNYADIVKKREISANPWAGELGAASDFLNYQQNEAKEAATEVIAKIKNLVKMDFAINDEAQLIRAFSSEGKAVEAGLTTKLDKLLAAWFAENNLISKDGFVYEGTSQGEIKRGADGVNPIKAPPAKVAQLLTDENGFRQFLKGKGIDTVIQQRQYPAAEAAKRPVREEAAAERAAREEPPPQPAAAKGPQV